MGSPVSNVRFNYSQVSETFGSGLEASNGGVQRVLELGLVVVAGCVVVVL